MIFKQVFRSYYHLRRSATKIINVMSNLKPIIQYTCTSSVSKVIFEIAKMFHMNFFESFLGDKIIASEKVFDS